MISLGVLLSLMGVFTMPLDKVPLLPVEKLPVISELPDPLLLPNGKRVQTKQEWEQHRATLAILEVGSSGIRPSLITDPAPDAPAVSA